MSAVGNEAGWALTFHRELPDGSLVDPPVLTTGIERYYAQIDAALAAALDGGSYRFVIEGMTLEDHALIAQGRAGHPTVVKLYLYWRDTVDSPLGFAMNLAGLTDSSATASYAALQDNRVAVLAITSVSRRLGARLYETTVEARERAYAKLRDTRLASAVKEVTFSAAARELGRRAGIEVAPAGFGGDGSLGGGPEVRTIDPGENCLRALAGLAFSVEQKTRQYGRGMALIRDGTVTFGPRPIPAPGTQPAVLTVGAGLIEAQAEPSVPTDLDFDAAGDPATTAPERRQFRLLLKGRPDLRPGDLVRFDLPPEEAPDSTAEEVGANYLAALDPFASSQMANPATLYVASVAHQLGRESGFSTSLTGVLVDPADPWDRHSSGGSRPERGGGEQTAATAAVDAAAAIHRLARGAVDAARGMEVSEVRESHAETSGDTVSRTVDVYRGLEAPDGLPDQARRLAIRREDPARVDGVATATPFAWGRCGLVVPRYPGTRVLLLHRNGHDDDPVDAGALWESGRGPDAKAGDWWLTLPVGFAGPVPAEGEAPAEHTGKVANDLIDADGGRIVQVAALTISVGAAGLPDAGTRPDTPSDDGAVTIENAGGARLTLGADGSVTIHAAKDIVLEAAGDIRLSASNVNVAVSGAMDVH